MGCGISAASGVDYLGLCMLGLVGNMAIQVDYVGQSKAHEGFPFRLWFDTRMLQGYC